MKKTKQSRREFIRKSIVCTSALAASGFASKIPSFSNHKSAYIKNSKIAQKVIVLGIDGMDPVLLRQMINDGEMPNFRRVAEMGHLGNLQTVMPPQSPVAWASFITGTNPGGHGIYDFIHRDPKTFIPYLSTSRSFDSKRKFSVGKYNIPLESGRVDLMRKGVAFWDILKESGIPSTIFSLPSNYPVQDGDGLIRAISGMGTPDLLGGYGRYTYYNEDQSRNDASLSGGWKINIRTSDHTVVDKLRGPQSPFISNSGYTETAVKFTRDPLNHIVKIDCQDHSIILKQGEWSEWLPIRFELLSVLATIPGIVRFYVKQVHPYLQIYATPVNVDPMEPALPICTPASYSKELAQSLGRFYTQGLPADTKALSEGTLDSHEFFQQAKLVLDESMRAFDYEFEKFNEGCFLFYFSSIDQNSHMLWRCMDPKHPLYEPNASQEVKQAIKYLYRKMDEVVGKTLTKVDSNTSFFALSDHGFVPFTREFNLSTWLVENGFTVMSRPDKMYEADFYQYVDWSKTKAFALGINGIYLNLREREKRGSLDLEKAEITKQEIIKKLLTVKDPLNGNSVIKNVYDSNQIYSGPYVHLAPDLQIGYARGYRISDQSILGRFPKGLVNDRTDKWSSDHCIDPSVVPGMLLSNKKCKIDAPSIIDLAPSILQAFGLSAPPSMTGKAIFEA